MEIWLYQKCVSNFGEIKERDSHILFNIILAINIEYQVSVFWYQVYQARLWERLLTSRGLPSDSKCVLKAEPGKLDIKRRDLGILLISLQADSPFKLAIMT